MVENVLQVSFKISKFRSNRFAGFVLAGQDIGSLQAVSGDAKNGGFIGGDASLGIELASATNRNSTGGFGENAFGFSQKLDGSSKLRIRNILGPAATLRDGFYGIVAVGGVADGEGASQGRGFLRIDFFAACFDCGGDGRATRGLRAKKLYRPWASTRPSRINSSKAFLILVINEPPAMGTTTLSGRRQPSCSAISKPTVFEPSAL